MDRKGNVSDGASVYSPGRRRKKNAMMIISAKAQRKTESGGKCWAMKHTCQRTWTGIVFTWCGWGSIFSHMEIVH